MHGVISVPDVTPCVILGNVLHYMFLGLRIALNNLFSDQQRDMKGMLVEERCYRQSGVTSTSHSSVPGLSQQGALYL